MIVESYYVTTSVSGSAMREDLISAFTAEAARGKAVRIRAMESGVTVDSIMVTACRPKAESVAPRTMTEGEWWRLVVSLIDVGAAMRHVHRSISDLNR